jgi:hypothetical protein
MGRRFARSGTEPVTARSPLGLRLLLSVIFTPLFIAAAVLFRLWSASSGPQDSPSSGELGAIAWVCAVLALLALLDLVVVLRRRGREQPPRAPRG